MGGAPVHPDEYQDLRKMMENAELFECKLASEHFTWSNRHKQDLILSRIDHVLGNVPCCLQYGQCNTEVLMPSISDHSPLSIELEIPIKKKISIFKFVNYLAECENLKEIVQKSGSPAR